MRTILLLSLLLIGCGKRDAAHQPGKIDEQEMSADELPIKTSPVQLAEGYTQNPASADEKFKGRIIEIEMPWLVMSQEGGKTILRNGRFVYRFASEEEAAKVKPGTFYRVRGRCEGLVGNDIVLSKVWLLGELERPITEGPGSKR